MHKILLILLTPVVLVGAHGAYWSWATSNLKARIIEWRSYQRDRGAEIDYEGPELGGYPTRIAISFREPRVRTADGWTWSGPEVTGSAALWSPFTVDLRFPGRHVMAHGGLGAPIEADVASGEAQVHLSVHGRVEEAQAHLRQVELRNTPEGPASLAALDLSLGPLIEGSGPTPQRLQVVGDVKGLRLPELPQNPLGPEVEQIAFSGTLVGRIDPGEPHAALAAWRDAGGEAQIATLEADWGPLSLDGDGSLALDERLRPLGAFSARISGLEETLDAMAREKLIGTGPAMLAKVAASAIAQETDDRGRPVVRLPITLQDGFLYLGPVPLVPLSPLL